MGALLYVGGAARKILAQFGVKTIGELAACKRDALETLMGKMGVQLHDYATGWTPIQSAPGTSRRW